MDTPVLGFYSCPDGFLIGEYFEGRGTYTAEFRLECTQYGFEAHIYDDAFELIPKLDKLWKKSRDIYSIEHMENFLLSIGLKKIEE